jgi:hypothetical protein
MKIKPLALAVAAALPVSVLASTISATATPVSNEFVVVSGGIQGVAAEYELGAAAALNDVFTFTYSASAKAGSSGTGAFAFPGTIAIAVGGTVGAGSSGVISLFDSSDTSVSYRVTTAPTTGAATNGDHTVAVPAPFFQAADIGTSDVTVTGSAKTASDAPYDSLRGTPAKIVDQAGSQFSFEVTGLSEVIDVESLLTAFEIGGASNSTAAFSITRETNAQALAGSAGVALADALTSAIVLTGDFDWLDSDTAATGIQTGAISITGGGAATVTANELSFEMPAGQSTAAVIFVANGTATIPAQTLSVSLTGAYDDITGTTSITGTHTGSASGTYTLNGSTVTVYAIPTSAAASNFIWLTNSGSSDGDVSLTIHDGGTDISLGVVGTSVAGSEFDIGGALTRELEAQGIQLNSGRVHMDVVTNVPSKDVAISAAYRVNDDRVNLITSLETDNDTAN